MKKLSLLALLSVLVFGSASSVALDLEAIKQKASKLNETKELLNNPDPSIRLAVIEAMMNSDDLTTRELGYQAGLASNDDAVRAITLRKRFNELKNIRLEIKLPENATEAQKEMFAHHSFSGSYNVAVYKYNEKDGNFRTHNSYSSSEYAATLTGTTLSGMYGNTSFKLHLNDESVFEGEISVTNKAGWTLPAKLVIQ